MSLKIFLLVAFVGITVGAKIESRNAGNENAHGTKELIRVARQMPGRFYGNSNPAAYDQQYAIPQQPPSGGFGGQQPASNFYELSIGGGPFGGHNFDGGYGDGGQQESESAYGPSYGPAKSKLGGGIPAPPYGGYYPGGGMKWPVQSGGFGKSVPYPMGPKGYPGSGFSPLGGPVHPAGPFAGKCLMPGCGCYSAMMQAKPPKPCSDKHFF